jgi:general secretion pathway protein I
MRARGFTLVEVMVALAIVAIALPAVLVALYRQADDTAYLRDKTLAMMVAANKLAEMRLAIASTRNLSAGKDNGTATLADRDWYWWLETKTTDADKFFRVEIRVAAQEEQQAQPLYILTAFMSGDLRQDDAGLPGGGGPGEDGSTGDGDTPVPETDANSQSDDGNLETGPIVNPDAELPAPIELPEGLPDGL